MGTFEAKLLYHGIVWYSLQSLNGDYTLTTPYCNTHFCRLIPSEEPDPVTSEIPCDILDLPSTLALPFLMNTQLLIFFPMPISSISALPFESLPRLPLFWCVADSAAKLHPFSGGEYVDYFFMTIVIKDLSWVKLSVRTLFILHESFNGTCSNCMHSSYSWWET